MQVWKVGELAKQTGITVRTLHHYDQIGLLTPSERDSTGYRLYTTDDVIRLQQTVITASPLVCARAPLRCNDHRRLKVARIRSRAAAKFCLSRGDHGGAPPVSTPAPRSDSMKSRTDNLS